MTARLTANRKSNPFCCRYFEPGNIPFLFHNEHSIESLAQKIRNGSNPKRSIQRWAIVGPHGSGKSTLIKQLSEQLDCQVHVLHSSTNKLGATRKIIAKLDRSPLCLVDGYEQLPHGARLWVAAYSRLKRVTLCVTAHRRPWGFDLLWQTRIDQQVEQHVLDCLLGGNSPALKTTLLESQAWKDSRAKQKENLRESLFDMYDWWRDTVDEYSRAR